ncbi:hypothetical protein [Burkholderia singularis]|uniref:hypothetical protein n=1 Tax=Burkholderia singularis TaxID=1503053 RepID=UPI00117DB6BF|nr:hypothetical protein [Burkholderia singularis]
MNKSHLPIRLKLSLVAFSFALIGSAHAGLPMTIPVTWKNWKGIPGHDVAYHVSLIDHTCLADFGPESFDVSTDGQVTINLKRLSATCLFDISWTVTTKLSNEKIAKVRVRYWEPLIGRGQVNVEHRPPAPAFFLEVKCNGKRCVNRSVDGGENGAVIQATGSSVVYLLSRTL